MVWVKGFRLQQPKHACVSGQCRNNCWWKTKANLNLLRITLTVAYRWKHFHFQYIHFSFGHPSPLFIYLIFSTWHYVSGQWERTIGNRTYLAETMFCSKALGGCTWRVRGKLSRKLWTSPKRGRHIGNRGAGVLCIPVLGLIWGFAHKIPVPQAPLARMHLAMPRVMLPP